MAMSQKAPNGEHSFWERFFLSPIVLFLLRLFFLTHSQLRTLKAEVEKASTRIASGHGKTSRSRSKGSAGFCLHKLYKDLTARI